MLAYPPRQKEGWSWFLAAAWTAVIYVTIPFARFIQRTIQGDGSEFIFVVIVVVAVVMATVWLLAILWRRRAQMSRYLALVVIATSYVAIALLFLSQNGVEALHLVQYGVLAVLVLRALSHRIADVTAYFLAALIVAIAGYGDEFIQWLVPERYWGLRDIVLNASAGVLALLGVAFVVTPERLQARPTAAAWRRVVRLSALAVVLLGLSLHATPDRIEWVSRHVPGFAFLGGMVDTMGEYGYRIENPLVGVFYSRFPEHEITEIDRRRPAETRRAFVALGGDARYQEFLSRYSPATDPFLHEFRVRLFRRDRYLEAGRREPDADLRERYLFAGARENRILELYYPYALMASGSTLPVDDTRLLDQFDVPGARYESLVGGNLITRFEEEQVAFIVLVVLAAFLALDLWLGRRGTRAVRGMAP